MKDDNWIPWIENAPGNIWHSMGPGGDIANFHSPEDGRQAVKEHNLFPQMVEVIEDAISFAEEMKAEFPEGWTRENQMHLDKLELVRSRAKT